jgi:hypothetical protein
LCDLEGEVGDPPCGSRCELSDPRWAPTNSCWEMRSGKNHLFHGMLMPASCTLVERLQTCRDVSVMPLINISDSFAYSLMYKSNSFLLHRASKDA